MATSTGTRVALVAGGSGGIGSAVARDLASQGMVVYVGGSGRSAAAAELAEAICASGQRAEAVRLDLRDDEAARCVCESVFEREGHLDVLVNCAAVCPEAPALGMEDAVWTDAMAVNLDGAFRLCRAAAQFMLLGRWGRVVNFSSISAVHGGRGQIGYATGKAGVEAMTRVLALELGRKGILVNCVAPGVIETDMSKRIRAEYEERLLGEIAVRRFGGVEEVAALVSFLVSDAASYITGQVIHVDGGMAL